MKNPSTAELLRRFYASEELALLQRAETLRISLSIFQRNYAELRAAVGYHKSPAAMRELFLPRNYKYIMMN
jgi:hypothetical protein